MVVYKISQEVQKFKILQAFTRSSLFKLLGTILGKCYSISLLVYSNFNKGCPSKSVNCKIDCNWGDKNNITLMDKLQTMQNKAAKIILNEPLYSTASEALARLNGITLKQRRFYHSCLLIYKCINGYTYHSMHGLINIRRLAWL